MEINIESAEGTFSINVQGRHSKNTYMGTFKVKCLLSPMEDIAADRKYRELIGMNPHLAPENIRQKAFALSQLEQRVIDMPPFWENDIMPGGHIKDDNVVLDVLDFAVEAQKAFIDMKEAELKARQERLTKAIKKRKIEKEPEIEVEDKTDEPEEVEIDS